MSRAKLYWITGLAGAGKTTLAKLLYTELKTIHDNLVILDGDCLRTLLKIEPDYSFQKRKSASMQYSRMCQALILQNINVICATVSMFDEVRLWNKSNIPNYIEIFLDIPLSTLQKRNKKKLYSSTNKDLDVVGVDVKAEFPTNPDIHLQPEPEQKPKQILKQLLLKLEYETHPKTILGLHPGCQKLQ